MTASQANQTQSLNMFLYISGSAEVLAIMGDFLFQDKQET